MGLLEGIVVGHDLRCSGDIALQSAFELAMRCTGGHDIAPNIVISALRAQPAQPDRADAPSHRAARLRQQRARRSGDRQNSQLKRVLHMERRKIRNPTI